MINKEILKKPRIKYAAIGIGFGIFVYIFSLFAYSTNFGEIVVNVLVILPFRLYLYIYDLFNLCPGCADKAFGLALITMPVYLGLLGFLIGYLIEKIKKKVKKPRKK